MSTRRDLVTRLLRALAARRAERNRSPWDVNGTDLIERIDRGMRISRRPGRHPGMEAERRQP